MIDSLSSDPEIFPWLTGLGPAADDLGIHLDMYPFQQRLIRVTALFERVRISKQQGITSSHF